MSEIRPKKIMIVLEDNGKDLFNFYLQGDVGRLSDNMVSPGDYSPAEYWGLEFLKLCTERLKQEGGVKKLNREDRRKQNVTTT